MRQQLQSLVDSAKRGQVTGNELQERFRSLQEKIEPLGVASAEVHRMLQEARSQFDTESASSSNDLVRQRPVHIEDADSVARGSPVIQDATGIGQGSSPQRSHDGLSAPSDLSVDPAPAVRPSPPPSPDREAPRYRLAAGAMQAAPPSSGQ